MAVVDTNNPLDGVDYVIPGNDDAIRAIQLYTSYAANAISEAKASSQTLSGDEDEFVEVKESSEEAKPKKKAATKKKVAVKKKATVKKKAAPKKKAAKASKEEVVESTESAEAADESVSE